mmetsp:Transcript_29919/g.86093  ORF Transcript_29919/g.86093 Transcript_29919/m.86093 type:complete len:246 (+) Transcript_29919:362-1099(+)
MLEQVRGQARVLRVVLRPGQRVLQVRGVFERPLRVPRRALLAGDVMVHVRRHTPRQGRCEQGRRQGDRTPKVDLQQPGVDEAQQRAGADVLHVPCAELPGLRPREPEHGQLGGHAVVLAPRDRHPPEVAALGQLLLHTQDPHRALQGVRKGHTAARRSWHALRTRERIRSDAVHWTLQVRQLPEVWLHRRLRGLERRRGVLPPRPVDRLEQVPRCCVVQSARAMLLSWNRAQDGAVHFGRAGRRM